MSASGDVYSKYGIDPNTDPWGTPNCKSLLCDVDPLTPMRSGDLTNVRQIPKREGDTLRSETLATQATN